MKAFNVLTFPLWAAIHNVFHQLSFTRTKSERTKSSACTDAVARRQVKAQQRGLGMVRAGLILRLNPRDLMKRQGSLHREEQ